MAIKVELFDPDTPNVTPGEPVVFTVNDTQRELIEVNTGVVGATGDKGDPGEGLGDHLAAENPHPQYRDPMSIIQGTDLNTVTESGIYVRPGSDNEGLNYPIDNFVGYLIVYKTINYIRQEATYLTNLDATYLGGRWVRTKSGHRNWTAWSRIDVLAHELKTDPHPQYLKSLDQEFFFPNDPSPFRAYIEEKPVDIESETFQALRLGLDALDEDDNIFMTAASEVSPLGVTSKYEWDGSSSRAGIDYSGKVFAEVRKADTDEHEITFMTPNGINGSSSNTGDPSWWSLSSAGFTSSSQTLNNSIRGGEISSSRADGTNQSSSVHLDGGSGTIHLSGANGGVQVSAPRKNIVFSHDDGTVMSTYTFANNSGSETIASREWVGSNATPIAHSNNAGNKHAAANISFAATSSNGVSVPAGTVQSAIQNLAGAVGSATGGVKVARLYNSTLPRDTSPGIYIINVTSSHPESEYPPEIQIPSGTLFSYMIPEYGGGYWNDLTFMTKSGVIYLASRQYIASPPSLWVEVDGELVEQPQEPYWTAPSWTRVAPIVISPNGSGYRITVSDDGTLGTQTL